jgi:predicted nuclease of predicted toxin-antitoxin system
MLFVLDEGVPASVGEMLVAAGHEVSSIREHVAPGTADPVVATVAEELDAILISFDGDFETIAPRVAIGMRQRFRRLSRIWMRCSEPQAAIRLRSILDLVVSEREIARANRDIRMLIWLSAGYIKIHR